MNNLNKIHAKCFSLNDLIVQVEQWKKMGEKVVFTNGCFDILHLGHITYLASTADYGSKLIVGLNTDISVRKQGKGPERPINPESARMLLLAALECIDAVVLFDGDTPLNLITELKPDVLAKGADYDPQCVDKSSKKYIVGSEIVRSYGGDVVAIPLVEGFSTTSVVNKLKFNYKD